MFKPHNLKGSLIMKKQKQYKDAAQRIYYKWDDALANNDVIGLLALYTEDATIESPLIPHLMGKETGVCSGTKEIRQLFEMLAERKPNIRKYYRNEYFSNGKQIIWEYPRLSPKGEQMDFVEVADLKNGLIHYHRVYWGWRGFQVIQDNAYHR